MRKALIFVVSFCFILSFAAAKGIEVSGNLGLDFGKFETGLAVGLTAGTPVTDKIVGEVEFFYYFGTMEDPRIYGLEVSGSAWDLNLVAKYPFKLENSKIKPYAAFGLGVMSTRGSVKADWGKWSDTETKFNIAPGVGFTYPLGDKGGIRADFRYLIMLGVNGDVVRGTVGYYRVLGGKK